MIIETHYLHRIKRKTIFAKSMINDDFFCTSLQYDAMRCIFTLGSRKSHGKYTCRSTLLQSLCMQ